MKRSIASLVTRSTSVAVRTVASVERRPSPDRPLQLLLMQQFRERFVHRGEVPDPMDVGFDAYSATYEDGILLMIFAIIGMRTRRSVDIGAGNIAGSNTANLIVNHGFDGLCIDADESAIANARRWYANHRHAGVFPPTLVVSRVTAENVNRLVADAGFAGEVDLLSLDIDGVDYWIWKALDVCDPRVVVLEYQDILGPDRAWTVPYAPDFSLRSHPENATEHNYCSASLRAFTELADERGYRLVGINRGGWNAFFVKRGLGDEHLPEVTVESCFTAPRTIAGMERRFPLIAHMPWQDVARVPV